MELRQNLRHSRFGPRTERLRRQASHYGAGKRILGIDPGIHGALALLSGSTVLDIWDTPITAWGKKHRIDTARLGDIFQASECDHAFIEQVGAMPGQGVSSMFSFGWAFGALLGGLGALDIPYTLVSPVQWKAALRVPAAKDGARARASQLLPAASHHWQRVKDDGRAEAALIALYGSRELGSEQVIDW